jgi:Domain of unknown function (DUF4382)
MIIVKRCTGIGMKYRPPVLIACLGALFGLLAGCNTRTDVSLTGNTPTQYSHVWITTQEVWFNTNGSAGPSDGGWEKFSLSTPTTIDLVTVNAGNLSNITTGLRVSPATYGQMLIMPLDQSTPLTTSASNAGALYNSEADYVDSAGATVQVPLEFLNPGQGLGIPTALKVPIGQVGLGTALGAVAAHNTTSTGLTSTGTTTTGTTTTGTTTGTTTLGSGSTGTSFGIGSSSTQSTTPDNSFAVVEDGTTDLVPFHYGSAGSGAGIRTGILLSQHASAYDVSKSGGISGQLTLTNITTATGGAPAIQVSAENLTADGSRHQVVLSTTVQSDGSFLLYPLAATTSGTFYDVVIHGPGIATIIIQSVEVTLPSSSSSSPFSASPMNTTTSTSSTNTSSSTTNTTTTGTVGSTANNVTAIGTLTPRAAPTAMPSFTANLATSPAATLPAGSLVKFYQTLARQGEVPYVIEYSPIDPFGEVLYAPQALSTATVDSGTWSSSGANITVVSAAPAEGAGTYLVAASAPAYNDGPVGGQNPPKVKAPASGTSTVTPTPALPALTLASGGVPGTLTATVTAASPGKYAEGQLLISHAGTLVATVPLTSAALSGSGTAVTASGLPAQTPTAVYYLMVRAWTTNPADLPVIQSYPTPVNMQGSASGSIELTVN